MQAPAQIHTPYRVAPDTWIVPETVPAAPGTVIASNSMVIAGAEPVLVDTGNLLSREGWLDAAFSIVEPDDVRWIFISHDDHDHVGNLDAVLERCPSASLVTSWFTVERLKRSYELPLDRMRWVNGGESFDAGDRRLVAVVPPMYDSPTTRGLYDTRTRVYWAADAFASLMPDHVTDTADIPRDLWVESFLFTNRVGTAWHTLVDSERFDEHVRRVQALGAEVITSAHGVTLRGAYIDDAFELTRRAARMDAPALPGQAELDAILAPIGAQ